MTQNDIGQTIKEMSEIEFPKGLHGKILRQIVFLRFRVPFLIVVVLLVLNLIISGWRVWEQLLDSEVFSFVSLLWSAIEFDFQSLVQFVTDVYEVAPVGYIALFAVNLAALLYVAFYLPRAFNKVKRVRAA